MPITELFVFRHGETDWNRERRFQGHTDIPLNETGRRQAQELKKILEPCAPQVFLTSDLSRARETAEIVNSSLKSPLFMDTALRECKLGDCEGMLRDDFAALYGESVWEKWSSVQEEDKDFGFPNGETKRIHLARMLNHLEEFCRGNPQYKKVAVSTHGGSLRRLIHNCQGAPDAPAAFHNCVLYKISFDLKSGAWLFGGQLR